MRRLLRHAGRWSGGSSAKRQAKSFRQLASHCAGAWSFLADKRQQAQRFTKRLAERDPQIARRQWPLGETAGHAALETA
jgi:hypothetical protein